MELVVGVEELVVRRVRESVGDGGSSEDSGFVSPAARDVPVNR